MSTMTLGTTEVELNDEGFFVRDRHPVHAQAVLYACKASVDLFGLEKNDFIPQVQDIITVGEFYDKAAGGQIIFT